MSGSTSGDPPDDPGGGVDRNRDRQARNAADDRSASGSEDSLRSERGPGRGRSSDGDGVTVEDDGVVRWFLNSDDGTVVMVRDVLSSVAIVAVVGLILFGVSGIWPPLVAVESGSMTPNMHRGDLIFVVDDDRYVGDNPADGTGVVTMENGQDSGYEKFGQPGDVIVFKPNGDDRQTPVIHRAHFWVEEGENWVDTKADEDIVGDATCAEVRTCPATHDGFITKGDANQGYDQYRNGISDIVRPEWVTGKAMFRIPWLGHVRLTFDSIFGGTVAPTPAVDSGTADVTQIQAGLAGATGLAGTSAGVAVAIGRYRNRP